MHLHRFPALGRRLAGRSMRAFVIVSAALILGGTSPVVIAAPELPAISVASRAQNVGWLSSEQTSALNVGIDVLVPSWVPAPFDSVPPSISSAGGYYELYWMVPGGPPTFLQIYGVAGGSLPAGSPADLNKQLAVNASVQGWPAVHDIGIPAGSDTPIYDQVWWIADGVLYSVSSLNMTGSDTMSLANSLVLLEQPAPPAPEPQEQAPPSAPEPAPDTAPSSGNSGGDGGGGTAEEPRAPEGGESASSSVPGEESQGSEDVAPTPTSAAESQSSGATTDTQSSGPLPSDGTDGPRPPVMGSDGTGGTRDLVLPRIP